MEQNKREYKYLTYEKAADIASAMLADAFATYKTALIYIMQYAAEYVKLIKNTPMITNKSGKTKIDRKTLTAAQLRFIADFKEHMEQKEADEHFYCSKTFEIFVGGRFNGRDIMNGIREEVDWCMPKVLANYFRKGGKLW